MALPHRWNHLARHGLLGAGLVAAAARPADAGCYDTVDSTVALVIGANISPKLSFTGGIEVRSCVRENAEVMARFELGGDEPRFIAGARALPFADSSGDDEYIGIEAGLLVDFQKRFGAHLAAGWGLNVLSFNVQAAFPLSGPERPIRGSIVATAAPWEWATHATSVEGRPLIVDGQLVRPGFAAPLPQLASVEERAVRDHFASAAQFEYSSVWTFLRLAAELAAVGAPARLIAAALDAADDEVRHAELCAAVAGVSLSPLALAAAQPRFTQRTPAALAQLAFEAWLEGCLNEGAAAEEARVAASEATDAARAAMLATIARDEQGHAELSWQVLAWLFEVAPAIASSAIASAPAYSAGSEGADDPALARHGVPSARVTAHARAFAARSARERLGLLVA
jgi:hypothetical protein